MRVSLIYPIYLWLLILLPLAASLGWIAWRRSGSTRLWFSLALRLILMTAIILGLAGLQIRFRSNLLTTVFILDASDSIPPAEMQRGEDLIRAAIQSKPRDDQAAIVVFGEDALVERLASKDSGLGNIASVPVTTRTNIAAALQLAQAILPAEGAKRLVLLSDGRENIGKALEQAELADLNQTELLFVPLGFEPGVVEVLIESLEAPSEVRLGERFDLTAVIHSSAPTQADLRIFEDNDLIYSQEISLQTGINRLQIPITPSSDATEKTGFRRFRAQIIPDVDNRLQNNAASAFTVVHGPPNVLLVESQPEDGENLARALIAAEINLTRIPPASLPTTLPELARYDAIILVNVNAASLPAGSMQALPVFVRDLGRGLVMIGGDQSFGAGGYLRTPLEAALPVDMDVRDRELQANLALVLAVDKSGSMGRCHCDNPDLNQTYTRAEVGQPKVDIAKEAIMRAASALGSQDYLGVVAFDQQPHWVLQLSQLLDPASLEQAISSFQAEGQTNLQAGVQAAYQALQDIPARRKHIILMTDGWVRQGELTGLAQEMKDQGITLSVVAAGEGSAQYLASLAQLGGGSFYPAVDIFRVPEFFLKETVRSVGEYIVEEPFYPLPSAPSQVLRGIDAANLPPLLGYNGATAKNAARLDLITTRGDPLLATWQYGLGRSAAWTSDLKGQWAKEWLAWQNFQTFAAQLVRWTLPAPKVEGLEAEARLEDGQAVIRLTALDKDGLPLNYLQGSAVIIGPDLDSIEAPLKQVGPGQYEATSRLTQPGVYLARLGVNQGDQSLGQIALGLVVPYSPEYKTSGIDLRALNELARVTGGGELTDPQAAFIHNLPAVEQAREYWWSLLLLAALLFPLDVMLRRLNLTARDWQTAKAWLARQIARPRAAPTGQPRLLTPLFQARDRARHRRQSDNVPAPTNGEDISVTSARDRGSLKPPVVGLSDQPNSSADPEPPDQQVSPDENIQDHTTQDALARLREAKRRARR
jgi:Mg-chelatase subunit ChlD